MLAKDLGAEALDRALGALPCAVDVPREWIDFFSKSGPVPADPHERRRFPRFYLRRRALLEYQTTLGAFERAEAKCCVYTRDLARDGVSFLHVEQLFPNERMRLWLPDRQFEFHVVRCLRHNERCFEIGASFDAPIRPQATSVRTMRRAG